MNVLVEIAGREALPAWVLPYVTGWNLSPDMLLDRLVNPNYDPTATFPASFRLDAVDNLLLIPPEQWEGVAIRIKSIDEQLTSDELPIFTDRNEWHKRSIEIIKQLKAYVWFDEFQKWFDRQTYAYETYKIDEHDNNKVTIGPGIKLSLYPLLHEDHEQYFQDEAKLLKERQKATAQIKASRIVKSDFSNQKLLDNQLLDLIQESGLQDCEYYEYSFNLYVWKRQLADELKTINRKDYQDKKDYDDRIRALNLKIEEVDQYINNRPVSNATLKAVVEWNETLNNGQPIDWGYWKDLNNLTPVQAAKLAHMIDPILWSGDKYAAGKPYNHRYNGEKIDNDLSIKIQRLEQRLENHSLKWNLVNLVVFLGKDNAPFGMLQATSGSIGGCVEGDFNRRLNSLDEADKAIDEEIKALPGYSEIANDTPNQCIRNVHISIKNLLTKSVSEYLALSQYKPERQRTLVAVADNEDEAMELLHDLGVLENSKKMLEEELSRVQTVSYQFEESRKADINRISAKINEIDEWLENYQATGKLESMKQLGEIDTPKSKAETAEDDSKVKAVKKGTFDKRLDDLKSWLISLGYTLGDGIILLPKQYTHEVVYRELCMKSSVFSSFELNSFKTHFWKKQKIVKLTRGNKSAIL